MANAWLQEVGYPGILPLQSRGKRTPIMARRTLEKRQAT